MPIAQYVTSPEVPQGPTMALHSFQQNSINQAAYVNATTGGKGRRRIVRNLIRKATKSDEHIQEAEHRMNMRRKTTKKNYNGGTTTTPSGMVLVQPLPASSPAISNMNSGNNVYMQATSNQAVSSATNDSLVSNPTLPPAGTSYGGYRKKRTSKIIRRRKSGKRGRKSGRTTKTHRK